MVINMKIYELLIGEDEIYYDRRDSLDEDDCEVKYIVAESYESAEEIALKYMHDNYENVQYELYEWDCEEGILAVDKLEVVSLEE